MQKTMVVVDVSIGFPWLVINCLERRQNKFNLPFFVIAKVCAAIREILIVFLFHMYILSHA